MSERGIAADRDALDHVGIKRALGEKMIAGVRTFVGPVLREQLLRRLLEDPDEFVPDDFAFRLRIGHALEQLEETLRGIDVFESDLEIFAENALHDLGFVFAQEPVVDEDAGELVADRLVQERRGDRRIDPAAQAEHDFLVAHLPPHARAGLVDERAHRPIHRAVADAEDEILDDLLAARRVRHFGMKLQRVDLSCGDPRSRRRENFRYARRRGSLPAGR